MNESQAKQTLPDPARAIMLSPEAALQILRDLYASEINWSICTWWDGGYFVTLGQSADLIEGGASRSAWTTRPSLARSKPSFTAFRFEEAVEWLRDAAIRIHPESDFAQKYGRLQ